ncbi:hypothetical protein JTE90_018048 [Oedothorax gibbosus]|uniref:Integrase catalytic domain-containing protein n=1 Tax=Oedothorax gibbosus TaxID=931172 RepID=A0AAV6TI71_9ARAC|nr:hypothetical protein JTE90_018048 [Oedothorax gibbosus]
MKAVQQYIQEGWPKDRQSVSVLAKPYWNLQSELHIEGGLICRGQRLVIPRACRKEILQRIHVGHREFNKFCKDWDIFFNPSSPGFPRSNGQVERGVQTVKNSLIKAAHDNSDPHLVLMEYRNTPMDGLPSPAEILKGSFGFVL